jgi:hypothetical protein
LEPFECVEADDEYLREAPLKVRCPKCIRVPEERKAMMSKVCNRQETINKRFKDWAILDQQYRDIFSAIAVLSQIARVDPHLQRVQHEELVRHLTGFAGAVRQGAYRRGGKVRGGPVLTQPLAKPLPWTRE